MNICDENRVKTVSLIHDLLMKLEPGRHPFLAELPRLVIEKKLDGVGQDSLLQFVQMALAPDKTQQTEDAIGVLDRLIDPHTREFVNHPLQNITQGNRTFFWKEFGERTSGEEIVQHIVHKTVMYSNIGKKEQ